MKAAVPTIRLAVLTPWPPLPWNLILITLVPSHEKQQTGELLERRGLGKNLTTHDHITECINIRGNTLYKYVL